MVLPLSNSSEITGIIHDVRQMLMVITGRASLLQRRADDDDTLADLRTIVLAAGQAEEIMARLGGQGQGRGHEVPGDLRKALEQTALLACPEGLPSWHVAETVPEAPAAETWCMVLGVSAGLRTVVPQPVLREVLNNLALNARNVMPAGGVVTVTHKQADGHHILTLRDSGPGLSSAMRERVFNRGFTTSGDEGRGIGLAYSRELLARYDAELDLCPPDDDQPGACFCLKLPVQRVIPAECEKPPAAAGLPAGEFHPSVLVVDDEVAVREMLGDVLTELGCTATLARDARDAMELYQEGPYQLAFLDQSLPGLSGLDLADSLRRKDPDLVLVLISGWGQKEILDRAKGVGVDLVAEKPLTVDKIAELLDEAGALACRDSSGS